MTKPYTDVFGKALTSEEVAVMTRTVVMTKKPETTVIQRRLGWGYGKAARCMELLEDAQVVTPLNRGKRTIILKTEDAAINAALRQLKKGRN